jgi:D-galacturonate reductase
MSALDLGMERPSIGRQITKDEAGSFSEDSATGGAAPTVDVLMVGTGEYTTGYVDGKASDSDKGAGVVALTMIDLRRRGKTGRLALCGVNGKKFPGIRQHMKKCIADAYAGLDINVESFPGDNEVNPLSYIDALNTFKPGDAVIIFTPDDTHYEIAMAAVQRKLHVLVTKPIVKTLEEHTKLHEAAEANGVLCMVEVHKRWDPIYTDARDRIQNLGKFSYIYSYMSQPKHQLETFKSWAGKSSDISYYLNSHHIDFHEWSVGETSRPSLVTAVASKGVAKAKYNMDCEDTITLTVQWENLGENGV